MAHTLFRPTQPNRPQPLDATRIGAETGTIAINAVLLLVLLAPVAPRLVEHAAPRDPDVIFVRPVEPRPAVPAPTLPVTTTPPKAAEASKQQPQKAVDAAPPTDLIEPAPGDIAIDPPILNPVGTGERIIAPEPSADPGASLQALAAPPPPYPREAIRDRLEGTVVLDVHVDAHGRPTNVEVFSSSGHRALDRAAERQVLRAWRFRPAMQDGRAVPALGRVPVSFVLGE
ncbi:energy transducer TonB [Cognatilysobacter bugurensis]|uniref:Cell envelope biogenesis protein TonB n=1 Tax=Cognatilysobacter bugurensis TaxID=543356 RepID=A0A918W730_9GAMM|nr:energy transducer TonB [Lysobacter bugurensis]GHA75638.1 cell envelope biogenesis protein TonB [Lysobacter bugurensis]